MSRWMHRFLLMAAVPFVIICFLASSKTDIVAAENVLSLQKPETLGQSLTSTASDFVYGTNDDLYTIIKYNGTSSNVVIPAAAKKIGSDVFKNNTTITSLSFESGTRLTEIGANAFYGCSNLKNVTFPSTLKYIGNSAFNKCTSMTAITIPSNVKRIGVQAFTDCESITSVTLSEGLIDLEKGAFGNLDKLTSVKIPASIKNDQSSNVGITGYDFGLNFNSYYEGGAFRECDALTNITFGSGTTTIANCLLGGISGLTNITIPDSVKTIEKCAFEDNTNLEKVTFGTSLITINNRAFSGCTSLGNVIFPSKLTYIGNSAFNKCTSMTAITIPSNVKRIGVQAFTDCESITSVTLSEGLIDLEKGAFGNLDKLTSVKIPASIKNDQSSNVGITGYDFGLNFNSYYEGGAFRECDALTNITFGSGTTTIANCLLGGISGLTNITIPDSVKTIEKCAFEDNTNLEKVTFGTSLITINNRAFSGCTSLEEANLQKTVTTIGKNAFYNDAKLQKVTMLRNVISIGNSAFNNFDVLTIYGCKGSYAETYANKNNATFVDISIPSTNISSNVKSIFIKPQEKVSVDYTLTPSNSNDIAALSSSDTTIVKIVDNQISTLKEGSVALTLTASSGVKTVVPVYVYNDAEKAKKVISFVTTLYSTTLDRSPDANGVSYWTNALSSGKQTGTQVVDYFVFGKEFTARNYCNEHFLTHLYKAIFSRDADASGLTYWEGLMAKGTTREAVLNGFLGGNEFKTLCSNAGISVGTLPALPAHGTIQTWTCSLDNKMDNGLGNFVLRMYTKCLGRDAEKTGASYWVGQLNTNKVGGTAVAEQFFLGTEFTKQNYSNTEYVTRLYRTIFGREPEAEGLSYWTGLLGKGTSRKTVLQGFTSGTEWSDICKKYGITK